jgi:hypothetical protein
MKPYKEYNFTDWINLSEDLKRDIQDHWTPLNLKLEKKTRNLILDKFIRSIGEGFYLCEFGYFAHYVMVSIHTE